MGRMFFSVSLIFDVKMMQLSSAMGRLWDKLVVVVSSTITNFDVLVAFCFNPWRFCLKQFRLAQLFFRSERFCDRCIPNPNLWFVIDGWRAAIFVFTGLRKWGEKIWYLDRNHECEYCAYCGDYSWSVYSIYCDESRWHHRSSEWGIPIMKELQSNLAHVFSLVFCVFRPFGDDPST